MPIIIDDILQGSPEWLKIRLGIPTASNFGKILTATGKVSATRNEYMIELACEAVSGRSEENFTSYRMKKGKEMEAESRMVYAMEHEELEVVQVGFVYKDKRKMYGCSPDALVNPGGVFETKDAKFTVQYKRLTDNKMVTSHIPQVQGELFCCKREWAHFQSYCSGLPVLCLRIERDEKYIARLSEELERFCYELVIMIKRLKEIKENQ